ncbi:hypothetical protein NLI96_g5660 [Meripilus lineatus]|uniref:Uncharacterized protein n=1 Tax=Meripilus lineatus TaxID=2056292 RepID=A0AAD5V4C7_9APHY|nr:hypothetical protein NLI96_g5660 [Physisporinus lineatus]
MTSHGQTHGHSDFQLSLSLTQPRHRGAYQSHYMLEVYSSAHYLKIRGSFLDQLDVRDTNGVSRSYPLGAIALTAYALQLAVLQFRDGWFTSGSKSFRKETSVNIWNGHVSNLALDIGSSDLEDFLGAIAGYHPQIHIPPPPSASLRYAPRIVGKGADVSSDEEEEYQSIIEESD